MRHAGIVHLFIALVWMFLSGNADIGGLGTGLLAGFLLLALFRKALGCEDYVRRVMSALFFGYRFIWQIVDANMRIARVALQRNAGTIRGQFMSYSIEELSEFETLLLCWCISLTPGTTVADRDLTGRTLILHAFASGEPDEISQRLDHDIKNRILAFTR
jgi:multicomponent Na+:H+ antiporter subunit E